MLGIEGSAGIQRARQAGLKVSTGGAKRAAEKHGVASENIRLEVARSGTVGGQEDLIEDVAAALAAQQAAA